MLKVVGITTTPPVWTVTIQRKVSGWRWSTAKTAARAIRQHTRQRPTVGAAGLGWLAASNNSGGSPPVVSGSSGTSFLPEHFGGQGRLRSTPLPSRPPERGLITVDFHFNISAAQREGA